MTDFPDLKLKALISYPANIIGGTGLTSTKSNGSIVLDFAWQEFGAINAIPTSPTSYILTYDTAFNSYVMVPAHLLGGAVSGIADAPADGSGPYGRQSANWVPLVGLAPAVTPPLMDGAAAIGTSPLFTRADHVHPTDTSRAPDTASSTDNILYGRQNHAWVPVPPAGISDAPPTGGPFGRQSNNWVDISTSTGGIADAPSNNLFYARKNTSWQIADTGEVNLWDFIPPAMIARIQNNTSGGDDHSSYFQSWLNALSAGAPGFIPAGWYRVASIISKNIGADKIKIRCGGMQNTVILVDGSVGAGGFIYLNASTSDTYFEFTDATLVFKGNVGTVISVITPSGGDTHWSGALLERLIIRPQNPGGVTDIFGTAIILNGVKSAILRDIDIGGAWAQGGLNYNGNAWADGSPWFLSGIGINLGNSPYALLDRVDVNMCSTGLSWIHNYSHVEGLEIRNSSFQGMRIGINCQWARGSTAATCDTLPLPFVYITATHCNARDHGIILWGIAQSWITNCLIYEQDQGADNGWVSYANSCFGVNSRAPKDIYLRDCQGVNILNNTFFYPGNPIRENIYVEAIAYTFPIGGAAGDTHEINIVGNVFSANCAHGVHVYGTRAWNIFVGPQNWAVGVIGNGNQSPGGWHSNDSQRVFDDTVDTGFGISVSGYDNYAPASPGDTSLVLRMKDNPSGTKTLRRIGVNSNSSGTTLFAGIPV